MSESTSRVLMIGLDAATFDLIEPWIEQGYLPNLARLMKDGAYGRLASTLQPLTAPAWVSFMTGMNQGQHGLYDFVRRKADGYSLEVTNSSHIAAPLMFETLSRLGQRVITVNIPYTYPPRPVNGIMLGGPFAPTVTRDIVYPPEYFETLKQIAPDYFITPDYDARGSDPLGQFAAKLRREVEMRERVSLALMQTQTWDVFTVVIMATDEVQHTFWHCMEAGDDDPLAKYQHVIRDVYERCDAAVGKLVDAARQDGRETNVIIMSDHGAGRFEWMVNLNQWLFEEGLLYFRAAAVKPAQKLRTAVVQRAAQLYRRYVPTEVRTSIRNRLGAQRFSQVQEEFQSALVTSMIDWPHTKAYALGAGGNIFINLKGREPEGAVEPGADYEAVRQQIIDQSLALRDPDKGTPMVRQSYRREEIYRGAKLDRAPDVVIQWTDYAYWGRGYYGSQTAVFEKQRKLDFSDQPLTGSHRPDGIMIAQGPRIRSGGQVQAARLIDLAPTVFHLLGFAPPADMDGRVLSEMLTETAATPIEVTQSANNALDPVEFTPEEAALVADHLRALGYL